LRNVYLGLALLFLAGIVVQFFLAGLGVFGAESFEAHRTFGYALQGSAIVLLVLALVGRLGSRLVWPSALLVLLVIVQGLLIAAKDSAPSVAALHVVNALAIAGVVVLVVQRAWRDRTAGRMP
jgi:hypothetical protein